MTSRGTFPSRIAMQPNTPSDRHLRLHPPSARSKGRTVTEFGDYQTPLDLALQACRLLADQGLAPASVLEPTCGTGAFLVAALETFPTVTTAVGVEINPQHVELARTAAEQVTTNADRLILQEDFFTADWAAILDPLPSPLLIIGNPPWVTSSQLGTFGGSNLPPRLNFAGQRGIEAITGSGNFDISEWMLLRTVEWMEHKAAIIAMLCKTAVARKVLLHTWKTGRGPVDAQLHPVSAGKQFGVAVDACLLVLKKGSTASATQECRVSRGLDAPTPTSTFGYRRGGLVADVGSYDRLSRLDGTSLRKWRSGIKHDCAKVMELYRDGPLWRNGLSERMKLEPDYLYPMLKGSQISKSSGPVPSRWMLVTQRSVREETASIRLQAPRTWKYLTDHGDALDRRASTVYARQPRFALFGVGQYSFSPWKVAVGGFSKEPVFTVVGPWEGKPVVFDDTCYFLACQGRREAEAFGGMLNSNPARQFLSSLLFRDAKRPVTAALLRRLDLHGLARELGVEELVAEFLEER